MMRPKKWDRDHMSASKMKQKTEGDDSLSAEQAFRVGFFPLSIKESCAPPPFKHRHVPLLELWSITHPQDKARQVCIQNPRGLLSPVLAPPASCAHQPAYLSKLLNWLVTAGSMWQLFQPRAWAEKGSRATLSRGGPQAGVFFNRFQFMGRDMVENCIFIRENEPLMR